MRNVAYRMLGSLSEAEDAVQQAWLQAERAGADGIDNPSGWLTTVVARVCLDMLRARKSRREEPVGPDTSEPARDEAALDPEQEAALADSVGVALLVVLQTLGPAERIAFVLHEMFELPFEEIAPLVGRSPEAARQLASRARRRVRGANAEVGAGLARQREIVTAYLTASRAHDLGALVSLLDPNVEVHADLSAVPPGMPTHARGVEAVARRALLAGSGRARFAEVALVDGAPGLVFAPRGRLRLVLRFTIARDLITRIDVVGDPASLAKIELSVLG